MYLLKILTADVMLLLLLKYCSIDGTIKYNRVVIEHEDWEQVGRWWGKMFLTVSLSLFTM